MTVERSVDCADSPRVPADLLWSLRRAVTQRGDRIAVVDGSTRLTYDEFAGRVNAMSSGLRGFGCASGDRVGVLAANSADYLAAYFAVPGGDQLLVPLNQRLADPELAGVIDDCEISIVVVDDSHRERASTLARRASRPMQVRTFDEVNRAGDPREVLSTPTDRSPDERPAAIFYTGGTSGKAKGVVLSHAALTANAMHMLIGLGYSDSDVYLHCSPMFHLGDGMSVHALTWVGASHVIVERFEPSLVVDAIEREGVTCFFVVPAMLTLLLEYLESSGRRPDLSRLRLVVHGGAPITPALLERSLERLGCSFTQSYGMTEAGPIVSLLTNEEGRVASPTLASAGQPVVGAEVRVVRADGSDCDPGEVGEILVRGPGFAAGYWGQPELTAERFAGGWYRSGDLAHRDEHEYLYIVGRTGDVIISGGENVYAAEVEAALTAHPDVVEAAVVAVPSSRWGEQVHAAVVVRSGSPVTDDELDAHCRSRIAAYKTPRSWERRAELPRTGAGKIDKLAIRAPHWDGFERQVS